LGPQVGQLSVSFDENLLRDVFRIVEIPYARKRYAENRVFVSLDDRIETLLRVRQSDDD